MRSELFLAQRLSLYYNWLKAVCVCVYLCVSHNGTNHTHYVYVNVAGMICAVVTRVVNFSEI